MRANGAALDVADDSGGSDGSGVGRTGAGSIAAGWLRVIRALWLAFAVVSLGLFAASLPVYYTRIQRPCHGADACNLSGALTAQGLAQLPALGLSPTSYAAFITIFFVVIVALWSGIGFAIFWRRPNDWFALFTALFLVMFNTTYPGFPITALAFAFPALTLPISLLGALGVYSIIAFLTLFPNGRLVPRWMAIILVLGAFGALTTAFPNLQFATNGPAWIDPLLNIPQYGAIILAQVYRYRRVSSPTERQQTKWVVFGIVIVLIGIALPYPIFSLLIPTFNQSNTLLATILGLVNYPIVLLALPITIGAAILRSRLYDIDVLINRTLVYGALTILLALLYFGLIVGLETLARLIPGQGGQSPVAITISTLAIVALSRPLLRRVQAVIDRRFYRHKYDATQTIATFGARQRSEVDLDALSQHLMVAVQETMQPAHISLWLRPTNTMRQRNTEA